MREKYIVTGGAGFIGSNIVKALNDRGINDILIVDDLTDGKKCLNLSDLDFDDYMDMYDFIKLIRSNQINRHIVKAVFHEGACSSTTEWDGKYLMDVNYQYSKDLLNWCINNDIQFSYASSASVYGNNTTFSEERCNENPLNMYAFSKFQFDQYVRRKINNSFSQIVGFRYFNVYGPREQHKNGMYSVVYHLYKQFHNDGKLKLFGEYDGYSAGEQKRDFIYIDDLVDAKLWFLDNPNKKGIFNLGTGKAESFKKIADSIIEYYDEGEIEYIPFPDHLKGKYQSFTESNNTSLRKIGYNKSFKNVSEGVNLYIEWLDEKT